jgi:L-ascorbate metabolism protein UlaG (beta-lactamase superfamily)
VAAEGAEKMRGAGIAPERIRTIAAGDGAVPVHSLDNGDTDVHADVVYASHSGDAVGFVFAVGQPPGALRVYVTGDSLYEPALVSPATRGVDVLCVCINGRLGNMTYQEAARLADELGARTVVPMHYGVMPHNTIDPQLFLDELAAQGYNAAPRALQIGETVVLGR